MTLKLELGPNEKIGDVSNLDIAQAVYDLCCQMPYADAGVVAQLLQIQDKYDKDVYNGMLNRPIEECKKKS